MSAGAAKIAAVIIRTLRACVAVLLAALASAATGAAATGWSSPSVLGGCAAAIAPRVAFPGESPSRPTGPGAVVWAEDAHCGASHQAGGFALSEAALGRDDGVAGTAQTVLAPAATALDAAGASEGRVAVAVAVATLPEGSARGLLVLEGRAPTSLPTASLPIAAPPFSLAHAYLGDSAIATLEPGHAIAVRVERYFRSDFAPPLRIPVDSAPVSALVATMDYRSDVLLAWQQNGAIYAHMLRASGRREPTQRVGASAPYPQLRALVSDNDHGMVAWSSAEGPASSATGVRIAFSGAGVRFAGSRLIASFADPGGAGRAPGSLALERLSTENVMLAWTDAEAGGYVVRAAPAVLAGTGPSTRLGDPSEQSVLAGLAAGPAGEAFALWRSSPRGYAREAARSRLWAARTVIERHGRVAARAAELVAPEAAASGANLAVDPGSDRPVAAWLTPGARPRVEYAAGPGASGYRSRPTVVAAAHAAGGGHPLRIAVAAAAAAAAAVALTILALRRRAGSRRAGGAASGTRRRR